MLFVLTVLTTDKAIVLVPIGSGGGNRARKDQQTGREGQTEQRTKGFVQEEEQGLGNGGGYGDKEFAISLLGGGG